MKRLVKTASGWQLMQDAAHQVPHTVASMGPMVDSGLDILKHLLVNTPLNIAGGALHARSNKRKKDATQKKSIVEKQFNL